MRNTLELARTGGHVQAGDTAVSGDVRARSMLTRWLVALPLLFGVAAQLWWSALALGAATDMSFHPGNLAVGLVPAVLYAIAAVLLLGDRPQRLAWIVLLLLGAALTAVVLAYLVQYREPGELMLFPPYLAVVAMVELERLRRRSPSEATEQQ